MDLKPHIEKFRQRFAELETLLSDPKTFANNQKFQELSREYARLKELVASGEAYLKVARDLEDNRAVARELKRRIPNWRRWRARKLPGWSRKKNVWPSRCSSVFCRPIRRIRATPSLKFARARAGPSPRFSRPTFTGCTRAMPKTRGWKVETMDSSPCDLGGFKEIIFNVTGTDVFKRLKYESGVHRVQRVPGNGGAGPHSHQHLHRGRVARSAGSGHRDQDLRNWRSTPAAHRAKADRA